jgi:hypothetical protein
MVELSLAASSSVWSKHPSSQVSCSICQSGTRSESDNSVTCNDLLADYFSTLGTSSPNVTRSFIPDLSSRALSATSSLQVY